MAVSETGNPKPVVIGILAIQGDFQAHGHSLSRLDVPYRFVKKAAELEELSGLIIPGGESTTVLKFMENEGLWEPIQALGRQIPIFGTCAGAILLAKTVLNPFQPSFGFLDMTVRRNAYGRQIYSFIRNIELGKEITAGNDSTDSFEAVFIRAPIIEQIAAGAQVLSKLDGFPVLVRQDQFLACTFHPELSEDTRIHRYFCDMVGSRSRAASSTVRKATPKEATPKKKP